MPDTAFTGHLNRGNAEGTIVGTLTEIPWGWTIHILGVLDPAGGYKLTATLGDPPAGLRIEAIDGPPDKVY
jgi:hypothetical protein